MKTSDRGFAPEKKEYRLCFDDIVANYDKMRPEYPDALFADIFNYAELKKDEKVIDIGAGTGKATVPFLAAGCDVTAVELSANMSAFLSAKFVHDKEHFNVITSSFEEAPLQENSYKLIYAATAFHWVDAEIGCPKIFRLLKDGGTFALFRYNFVPAFDELFDEIQEVYEKYYYTFYPTYERPVKNEDYWTSERLKYRFGLEDMKAYGFKDIFTKLYENTSRVFTADEYILHLDTVSDHIRLPDENREGLYTGIKNAIMKHGNHHRMNYIFQLYMGRK